MIRCPTAMPASSSAPADTAPTSARPALFGISGPTEDGNVIAFNGEMGVAVASGVADVAIRNNRIWGNKLLGIDIGLDGPTQQARASCTMPAVTLAHYDPVAGKTVIEGDFRRPPAKHVQRRDRLLRERRSRSDRPRRRAASNRRLGPESAANQPRHFRFAVDGDLTGQFISATMTRAVYVGFAKPEGIEQRVADADLGVQSVRSKCARRDQLDAAIRDCLAQSRIAQRLRSRASHA